MGKCWSTARKRLVGLLPPRCRFLLVPICLAFDRLTVFVGGPFPSLAPPLRSSLRGMFHSCIVPNSIANLLTPHSKNWLPQPRRLPSSTTSPSVTSMSRLLMTSALPTGTGPRHLLSLLRLFPLRSPSTCLLTMALLPPALTTPSVASITLLRPARVSSVVSPRPREPRAAAAMDDPIPTAPTPTCALAT